MACTFCGTNLTIPEELRVQVTARVADQSKARPAIGSTPQPQVDAPDLLRKAQPIAIRAWNAYAWWTWLRRLLPGCLIALVVLCLACMALGGLPFLLRLFR
jgi:hypothetical protein